MRNKTMPMYLFFIGAACLILVIPVIVIQMIDRFFYPTELNPVDDPSEWVEAVMLNTDDWGTESWKFQLDKQLRAYDMQVLVTLPDQTPIYQYHADRSVPLHEFNETHTETAYKTNVYHDGEWLGSVYLTSLQPRLISGENSSETVILWYLIASVSVLLVIFLFFIRRQIVKPIQSLIQASNSVAVGVYNVWIASSSIKELREVSESYRKMSESLAAFERQREEHDADRNFLLSSIVHDLRTPLFSMKGYLEGITQGIAKTGERKEQYLHRSIDLAHRLDNLISMLSSYNESYLSAKQLNLESSEISELVDKVIKGLHFQLEQRQVTVIKRYDVCKKMKIDLDLMYRALENVFINAIRFSPEQGKIRVTIEQHDAGSIRILIQDEGPGFSEHELEEVFKPLYQADKSRGSRHPGIGLGLAISKTIIEHHGGTIRAHNNQHQGATLVIQLTPF